MGKEMIQEIAAQLGMTVEQVWPWFIRAQYIQAGYGAFFVLLGLLALVFGWRFLMRKDLDAGDYIEDLDGPQVFSIAAATAGALLAVILGSIPVVSLLNVEYRALYDLLDMVPK